MEDKLKVGDYCKIKDRFQAFYILGLAEQYNIPISPGSVLLELKEDENARGNNFPNILYGYRAIGDKDLGLYSPMYPDSSATMYTFQQFCNKIINGT